ncbi:peptidoglycan/LPS O-acetylase OafA/YrhL [Agromyces hippuratus]|uniref:Peptidoglycan/LPS O-acetylase OafA/YrhL n=1 Tax=Agromyces hippuratus TaxID=286438 RepID=A0A852WSQ8_9MICO|nr:acyltransferase [Agromyces hippuratus]NYG21292.1 peptidoglycan/LPS O-acetylase OafA/YrhL [Agromyces hippuratus]
MTDVQAPSTDHGTAAAARRSPAVPHDSAVARDSSVDAIRVALLVVVFALHAMMVGVSVGPDGPVLENALEGQSWFAAVSWVVQIMPLFFIAGGFSSFLHWRSMRARGASGADYVRARIERLVRPAIVLVGVVAAALVALSLAGLAPELVATAGFRIGQPLWFLGVYLATSALVPVMVRAHERARVLTPIALLAGVVAVDLLRLSTGLEGLGFVNLLLVWLLVQQLGFHLADGTLDRCSPAALWSVAGGALALLATITLSGPYSADMYENLNPPNVCLVVLGVAQLALFQLARPRIRAWVERADASRLVSAVGERAMTVYLWHMPVLVGLAGVLLVAEARIGFALPEPMSAGWWASRPMWLAVAAVVVVGVTLVFARFERAPQGARPVMRRSSTAGSAAIDALCGVTGVAVVLVTGFGPVQAAIALALLTIALRGSANLGAAFAGATAAMRNQRRSRRNGIATASQAATAA